MEVMLSELVVCGGLACVRTSELIVTLPPVARTVPSLIHAI